MTLHNFEGLEVTLRKGLQIIKFNRPSKKNAFTTQMYDGITSLLNEAATDDRVVMTALTGTGDFYSSGNDISSAVASFPTNTEDLSSSVKESSDRIRKFVAAFINYPKILVAVVNGPAIGIAATTLGLCDVVYASHKAYFLTPFTKLGLVAEGCSSYTFPRIMGMSKASELLYFGHQMSAHEAKECGLISQVFPHDQFEEQVWSKMEQLVQMPKESMRASKQLVRGLIIDELHKANDAECKALEERWQSGETFNAILEFFNKKNKM